MGEGERGRKLVAPFPTMRVRDCLRVTAVIEFRCFYCRHAITPDVIGLACERGLRDRIMDAAKRWGCPAHGVDQHQYREVGAPPMPYYDLQWHHIIEPACRIVARCRACHRSRDLNALELGSNHAVGPDARLIDLQDRLRCVGCGQRGWTRIQLEW